MPLLNKIDLQLSFVVFTLRKIFIGGNLVKNMDEEAKWRISIGLKKLVSPPSLSWLSIKANIVFCCTTNIIKIFS